MQKNDEWRAGNQNKKVWNSFHANFGGCNGPSFPFVLEINSQLAFCPFKNLESEQKRKKVDVVE